MWFIVSVLVACGGNETLDPTPTTFDSATSPSTGSDSTETGTTSSSSTWECGSWTSCQNCGASNCLPEVSACIYNPACSPAIDAWATCVDQCGNPNECAATFEANGGGNATLVLECVAARCAAACGML